MTATIEIGLTPGQQLQVELMLAGILPGAGFDLDQPADGMLRRALTLTHEQGSAEPGETVRMCALEGHPLADLLVAQTQSLATGLALAGSITAHADYVARDFPRAADKTGCVTVVVDDCCHVDFAGALLDALKTQHPKQIYLLRWHERSHARTPAEVALDRAFIHAEERLRAQWREELDAPQVQRLDLTKWHADCATDVLLNTDIAQALGGTTLAGPFSGTDDVTLPVIALPDERALNKALAQRTRTEETWSEVADALLTAADVVSREGFTVLLTGLSGSGKSTIAQVLCEELIYRTGRPVSLLDGDVVRRHLSKGLGFSAEDRETNILRIGYVAREICHHGGIAICAPIAPFSSTRQRFKQLIDAVGTYVEVHVATPLAVCEARDPKGLYKQARAGQIKDFTGIDSPYETPEHPDLRLDTERLDVEACVQAVMDTLDRAALL